MTKNELGQSLKRYVQAALGRKAIDLVLLDVRNVTDVADVFMICSGRSHRQVSAIAEHIERDLRKNGVKPLSVEGVKEGHWALLDYGDVIVHVFYEPIRQFYDIEGLWADAGRIDVETLAERPEQADKGELSKRSNG